MIRGLKKYFLLIILLILFVIFTGQSIILIRNREGNSSGTMQLIYPYKAINDNHGNIYYIDNYFKRVVKINKDAELIFELNGGTEERDFFYSGGIFYDNANSTLYLLNYQNFSDEAHNNPSSILAYNEKGKLIKNIETNSFASEDSEIIKILDNDIYYIEANEEDTKKILYRINFHDLSKKELLLEFDKKSWAIITAFDLLEDKMIVIQKGNQLFEIIYGEDTKKRIAGISQEEFLAGDIIGEKSGRIYLLNKLQTRVAFFENQELEIYLNRKIIENSGHINDRIFFRDSFIDDTANFITIDDKHETILVFDENGNKTKSIAEVKLNFYQIIKKNILLFSITAQIFILLYIIYYIYTKLLNRRVTFILKLLIAVIPLSMVLVAMISYEIYQENYLRYQDLLNSKLLSLAETYADQIDGDTIEEIFGESYYSEEELTHNFKELNKENTEKYKSFKNEIMTLTEEKFSKWNHNIYPALGLIHGRDIYEIVMRGTSYALSPHPELYTSYENAIRDGISGFYSYDNQFGERMGAVSAVRNSNDKVVGIFEVYSDEFLLRTITEKFRIRLFRNLLILLFVYILVLIFFSKQLVKPIKELSDVTEKITEGNFSTKAEIKSKDEIGDLSKHFNKMTNHINRYIDAQSKFVPNEFLKILNKTDLRELKLGNQIKKEMTILFCDIRSFTSMSEKMTAQENFDFINEYLSKTVPAINKYNGFIDKFIGDAIMALFYTDDSAVDASLEMLKNLEEYNKERVNNNLDEIKIGIGLHTGDVMMGIVGEESRYNVTVISDNVNLASRIESMTKQYGVEILISDKTKDIINQEKYVIRIIDKVVARGRTEETILYEVIRDDRFSEEWLVKYQSAIESYFAKDFEIALEKFRELDLIINDKVVNLYINRCSNS